MTFDLFSPTDEPPAPKPPERCTAALSDARRVFEAGKPARDLESCDLPFRSAHTGSGYRCRVGGGSAPYSEDGGRTHFCRKHRPWGFLPGERDVGQAAARW